ncbi:sensor histidine kinase [Chitinophaga rhizosphaerae]|uniref:sensor histidine kinase n=1 Tax=Chitinophaga rhizosphaerae TaxID=1864947 RepID=UPI000F7FF686|nr:histidine kinase [Chitinophaga rhizosphaerae]
MRNNETALGFNDKWFVLLGIPVLGFLTPIMYFGVRFTREPRYTWLAFAFSVAITALFWLGNRWIIIRTRRKYPLLAQAPKRIAIMVLLMFAFTFAVSNFNGITPPLWSAVLLPYPDLNIVGMVNTLIIAGIYEVIWYQAQLRLSMQGQEDLRNESLQAQIRALKTQVDPHFLFNNLNTLSSVVHSDPDKAEHFIQQLSKLYRHMLEVQDTTLVTVKEELGLLDAYVYLLKTRFGDNLRVTIDVPPACHDRRIIPFALQIVVENAMKHNVVSAARPLNVKIEVVQDKIVVTNNLQRKMHAVPSTGKGLENINSRVRLLREQEVESVVTADHFIVLLPLFPAT